MAELPFDKFNRDGFDLSEVIRGALNQPDEGKALRIALEASKLSSPFDVFRALISEHFELKKEMSDGEDITATTPGG